MHSAFSSQTVPSGQIPGRFEHPTSWLPMNPLTHCPHLKEPGVLMHKEFCTQPPLLLLHSLISEHTCLCLNEIKHGEATLYKEEYFFNTTLKQNLDLHLRSHHCQRIPWDKDHTWSQEWYCNRSLVQHKDLPNHIHPHQSNRCHCQSILEDMVHICSMVACPSWSIELPRRKSFRFLIQTSN